jgi:hypothetical protein
VGVGTQTNNDEDKETSKGHVRVGICRFGVSYLLRFCTTAATANEAKIYAYGTAMELGGCDGKDGIHDWYGLQGDDNRRHLCSNNEKCS